MNHEVDPESLETIPVLSQPTVDFSLGKIVDVYDAEVREHTQRVQDLRVQLDAEGLTAGEAKKIRKEIARQEQILDGIIGVLEQTANKIEV